MDLDRVYELYAHPGRTPAQVVASMTYGLWAFAEIRPKSRAARIVRAYMEQKKPA